MDTTIKKADSKVFKFLPLTLRIETLGGIGTPIVLRGTPLPTLRSQTFSTASDDQAAVTINVLMGESPIAKQNLLINTFELNELPKAKRGVPQIRVNFEIDQTCNVTASAIEEKSGKKITVDIANTQPHLTDSEIKRLLQQAEATKTTDEELLKLLEAKNSAKLVISRAEERLRDCQKSGLISEADKKIELLLAELGLTLETEDAEKIRIKVQELEKLVPIAAFANFGSFWNNGDIFSSAFGTQQTERKKTPQPSQQSTAKTSQPKSSKNINQNHTQLSTANKNKEQVGKIFGGGEFTIDPNLCFVLMPFSTEMQPIYDDHICKVVESEGLSCLRADKIVGATLITWDVWEKINRSRFLIADLTGKNANVFYEVGLAHALGKDVILMVQTIDDVPFDLKAIRCIIYSYTPRGVKDLETKLRETIKEIVSAQ